MSTEDLEKRLSSHQQKLEGIEAALVQKPEDEVLLGLCADLKQVIKLTEDLLKVRRSKTEVKKPKKEKVEKEWKEGDICIAKWSDGNWYYAKITEMVNVGPETSFKILYLEYGNSWEVSAFEMRPLYLPEWSHLIPKTKCKAIFPADGFLYPGEIVRSLDGDKFLVKFERANIELELGVEHILWASVKEDTLPKMKGLEDQIEFDDEGNIKLPEHLIVKASDSDEQKAKKRKKIKSAKARHKKQLKEAAQKSRQNSWQSFQKGLGPKKASLFSTSDSSKRKSMTEYTSIGRVDKKPKETL